MSKNGEGAIDPSPQAELQKSLAEIHIAEIQPVISSLRQEFPILAHAVIRITALSAFIIIQDNHTYSIKLSARGLLFNV